MPDKSNTMQRYNDRYVAFIDMLGFTEHVRKSLQDRELFKTLRDVVSAKAITANGKRPDAVLSYQFSDSIVISTTNDLQGLKEIIESVWLVCDKLLCYRVLTRGGITKGKLYADSKAVFGPALIKAYHIENNVAVYPRILMDNCIPGWPLENPPPVAGSKSPTPRLAERGVI